MDKTNCLKQIYLRVAINNYPMLGLVDTGADVCLVGSEMLRNKITRSLLNQPDLSPHPSKVKTFTGSNIQIKKLLLLPISVGKATFEFPFYVAQPSQNAIKLVLGRNFLQYLEASVMFQNQEGLLDDPCEGHLYMLKCKLPIPQQISMLHLAIPGCYAVISVENKDLSPGQECYVKFGLNYNPFLTDSDHVLITNCPGTTNESFVIIPTKCKPEFLSNGHVEAVGLVVNKSNQKLTTDKLQAALEPLPAGQYNFFTFNPANKVQIINHLEKYGLARLNLPTEGGIGQSGLADSTTQPVKAPGRVVCATVNPIQVLENPNCKSKQTRQRNKSLKANNYFEIQSSSICNFHQQTQCFTILSTEIDEGLPQVETHNEGYADDLLDEAGGLYLAIPPKIDSQILELVDLDKFDKKFKPYIKSIFVDKYSSVVGRHNLDAGQLRYLGKVTLRTKPGVTLPRWRKMYTVNQLEQRHLSDIVEFLVKYEIIRETFQDTEGSFSSPWGAPAQLVSRRFKEGEPNQGLSGLARIVVNYRGNLNDVILPTPQLVASIETCLEKLRTGYLYSVLDLKQSYFGLTLDTPSENLTQFLVPPGKSFCFKRLPMGLTSAPASLLEKLNTVFNYIPVRDNKGQIKFKPGENPNDVTSKAELEYSPLQGVVNFYDDILVMSEKVEPDDSNDSKSIRLHFNMLEKVVERMALYDLKTSFNKCTFAERQVLFLGWLVADGQMKPDPRRLEKVKAFEFPKTRKQLQSFLGLVNTMKRITPLQTGEFMSPLLALASSKIKYEPQEQHLKSFEKVKEILTGPELCCSLITPENDKVIFTDSSLTAFGSVLLEKITDEKGVDEPFQKSSIDQKSLDRLDQVLKKWELSYERREIAGHPSDSFYNSIIYIAKQNNLTSVPETIIELKAQIVKFLRRDTLGGQAKEFLFKGNHKEFLNYLYSKVQALKVKIDPQSVILEAITKMYDRGILIIYDDPESDCPPIRDIKQHVKRACAPIKLGYRQKEQAFVPLFDYNDFEFDSTMLNAKYKVCYYDSKVIPAAHRNKSILELEATSLLLALKKYEKYIKTCNTYVIIDSRSLYYLFSPAIHQNYAKISRYHLKLSQDYPSCKIMWCQTRENIADIFTRFGLEKEYLTKIKFRDFKIQNLPEIPLGKTLTWATWQKIVEAHPQCMDMLVDLEKTYQTRAGVKLRRLRDIYDPQDGSAETGDKRRVLDAQLISHPAPSEGQGQSLLPPRASRQCRGRTLAHLQHDKREVQSKTLPTVNHLYLDNICSLTNNIDAIRNKLSYSNIKTEQDKEFKELFELTRGSDHLVKYQTFFIKNLDGIIHYSKRENNDENNALLILLPSSLELYALSLFHIKLGHIGARQLAFEISRNYRFISTNFHQMCREFCRACFHCFIATNATRRVALGILSLNDINKPFSCFMMDLAEDLPATRKKHKNVLLLKCILTSFLLQYPLVGKTSSEVYFCLVTNVFPIFGLPKLIASDNGPAFRGSELIEWLTAMDIKVMLSPALSPESRGYIERSVEHVKISLSKILSAKYSRTYQMDTLVSLISLVYNNTHNARVGNTPSYLALGRSTLDEGMFKTENAVIKQHPYLLKNPLNAEKHKKSLYDMYQKVKQEILATQQINAKKVKSPIQKEVKAGDIVFVKGKTGPTGVKRVLQTLYQSTPYIVVSFTKTYVVLQRITDQFVTIRHFNDIKLYRESKLLDQIPEPVRTYLCGNFLDLKQEEVNSIIENTNLEHLSESIPEQALRELDGADDRDIFLLAESEPPAEPESKELTLKQEEPAIKNSDQLSKRGKSKEESGTLKKGDEEESSDSEGEEIGKRELRNRTVTFDLP